MFKPSKSDWTSKIFSASVGASMATGYAAFRGQPPHICFLVLSTAVVITLVLEELGWV